MILTDLTDEEIIKYRDKIWDSVDFKKHKDVLAYFNKNYIHTEIFSKSLGRKISKASKLREDSDYDDEFIVSPEDTLRQIETAEELINSVEKYINSNII